MHAIDLHPTKTGIAAWRGSREWARPASQPRPIAGFCGASCQHIACVLQAMARNPDLLQPLPPSCLARVRSGGRASPALPREIRGTGTLRDGKCGSPCSALVYSTVVFACSQANDATSERGLTGCRRCAAKVGASSKRAGAPAWPSLVPEPRAGRGCGPGKGEPLGKVVAAGLTRVVCQTHQSISFSSVYTPSASAVPNSLHLESVIPAFPWFRLVRRAQPPRPSAPHSPSASPPSPTSDHITTSKLRAASA